MEKRKLTKAQETIMDISKMAETWKTEERA